MILLGFFEGRAMRPGLVTIDLGFALAGYVSLAFGLRRTRVDVDRRTIVREYPLRRKTIVALAFSDVRKVEVVKRPDVVYWLSPRSTLDLNTPRFEVLAIPGKGEALSLGIETSKVAADRLAEDARIVLGLLSITS